MMIICAILFSNLTMQNKVMGRTRTGTAEVYAQSLSVDCDLDLLPSDMVLVRDTLSCHDAWSELDVKGNNLPFGGLTA